MSTSAGLRLEALLRARIGQSWPSSPYRIVVLQHGRVAAEIAHGLGRESHLPTLSIAKSVHATMLGIAVADGVISSPDDAIAAYYPEMADIPPGTGPKDGRHATGDDLRITFRQALSHVSGYLKPDEQPGEVFHYQTFAVNVVAHGMASAYGRYVPGALGPQQRTGIGDVIATRIRDRIGGSWSWRYRNFANLPAQARAGVFGNSVHFCASATDLARLGWLWCGAGDWFGDEVVPTDWMRECTSLAPLLRDRSDVVDPRYGQGFWVNHDHALWADLPSSSFAAWGRGGHNVWVAPDENVVVATSPLPLLPGESDGPETLGQRLLPEILDTLRSGRATTR